MAKSTTVIEAPENVELSLEDVTGTIEDLQSLEGVVERGLDSFMAVGTALSEISERKLYKLEGHTTFEDYARVKWNLDRSFAYKQIRASAAVKNLSEHFDAARLPKNEAQARELTVLKDEDQQVDAWTRALDTAEEKGQILPTAADVRAAVLDVKKETEGGEDDTEPEPEDPAKAHNRAVKSFPKIWSKLEDTFGLLEDLPIRAISVVVETDEDAGIFEGDVAALIDRIGSWHQLFLTDLEDYQEHRRAVKARIAANKRAKALGKTNGNAEPEDVEES